MAPSKKTTSQRKTKKASVDVTSSIEMMKLILKAAKVPFYILSSRDEVNEVKKTILNVQNQRFNVEQVIYLPVVEENGLEDGLSIAVGKYGYIFMTRIGFTVTMPLILEETMGNPQELLSYACKWLTAFVSDKVYGLVFHHQDKSLLFFLGPEGISEVSSYGAGLDYFSDLSLVPLKESQEGMNIQLIPIHIMKEDNPTFIAKKEATHLTEEVVDGLLAALYDTVLGGYDDEDEEYDDDEYDDEDIDPEFSEFLSRFLNGDEPKEEDPQEKSLNSLLDRIEQGNRKKEKRTSRKKKNPSIIDVEFRESVDEADSSEDSNPKKG
ncbi:MAG: hypothetical protein K2H85_11090 [Allobaculum sp.]|nr:hypothetical protein [Allobaculum sp.]